MSGHVVVRLRHNTAVRTRVIRLKTHKAVGTHGGKVQKHYDCLATWHKGSNSTAVRAHVIRFKTHKVVWKYGGKAQKHYGCLAT